MKLRSEVIFGGFLIVLVGLIIWVMLASSQVAKSSPGSRQAATNGPLSQTNGILTELRRFEATSEAPTPLIAPRETLTFGLDEVPILQRQVLRQPAWQFLAALIYIILSVYISKFLDFIINVRLKKWAAKTESKWDDLLLDLLRGPIKVVTFVVLLHFGLQLSSFLSKGLQILVAISLTYLALKCVDLLVFYWKERVSGGMVDKSIDEMLLPVISKTMKAFLVIVAVLVTSDNLGMDIKAALATLSVGSLALGLAAQDTLANVFGAMAICIDKPFRMGDFIKIDSFEGVVESIGLRSTRIRHPDGFLITIPNKTMGNATITNISRRANIKSQFVVGLTYDTPAEKVKIAVAALNQIFRAHPSTHDVLITFKEFADSALNIQVIHWFKARNFNEQMATIEELNLAMKKRFDEEGIQFAFPSRTLYLRQEAGTGPEQADGKGKRSVVASLGQPGK